MKREINLYNKKVKIFFDEERHIFTDENGDTIFGTTSITGLLDKSGALMGWVAKMMALYLNGLLSEGKPITSDSIELAKKEYRKLKAEAADIGTMIHEFAEKWITLKKKPEIPENEKVRNGAIAFLKWVKDTRVEFDNSELIVYSKKYNYAGIMDADGHIDGKKCIIDFKSSSGIYPEMFMQLSAYWLAREEELGKEYDLGYLVRFGKEDGNFEVKEISRKEHLKNKEAFLGLLKVRERLDEMKKCQ